MKNDPAAWEISQQAEKDFWENKPERYSHFSREYWQRELARDDLDFSFFHGARVVELGCGPYGMIHYLEDTKEKIGIDPLIETYERLGLLQDGGVRHLTGKCEEVKLAAESADIVISYNVLDHVDDPQDYIDEAFRLLTPGGVFYLNSHAFRGIPSPFLPMLHKIDKPHPWHFNGKQILQYITTAGFGIERTKSYPVIIGRSGIKPWLAKQFAVYQMVIARKPI